eukprot:m.143609 g.143609  ORF g.143609 m.143609 type:complete len:1808 (+) comp22992_c0_seq3:230-5653(+)
MRIAVWCLLAVAVVGIYGQGELNDDLGSGSGANGGPEEVVYPCDASHPADIALVIDATGSSVPGLQGARQIASALLTLLNQTERTRVSVLAYGSNTTVLQQLSLDFSGFNALTIAVQGGSPAIGAALGTTSADVFEGPASSVLVAKHAVVIHQSDTSESSFIFNRQRIRLVGGNTPGVTVHAVGPASARIATTVSEAAAQGIQAGMVGTTVGLQVVDAPAWAAAWMRYALCTDSTTTTTTTMAECPAPTQGTVQIPGCILTRTDFIFVVDVSLRSQASNADLTALVAAVIRRLPLDTIRVGAVAVDGTSVTTIFELGQYRCWEQMVAQIDRAFATASLLNYRSDLGLGVRTASNFSATHSNVVVLSSNSVPICDRSHRQCVSATSPDFGCISPTAFCDGTPNDCLYGDDEVGCIFPNPNNGLPRFHPSAVNTGLAACVDTSASGTGTPWQDSVGNSCYDYAERKWCLSDGTAGNSRLPFGASVADAVQHCCMCGGGVVNVTMEVNGARTTNLASVIADVSTTNLVAVHVVGIGGSYLREELFSLPAAVSSRTLPSSSNGEPIRVADELMASSVCRFTTPTSTATSSQTTSPTTSATTTMTSTPTSSATSTVTSTATTSGTTSPTTSVTMTPTSTPTTSATSTGTTSATTSPSTTATSTVTSTATTTPEICAFNSLDIVFVYQETASLVGIRDQVVSLLGYMVDELPIGPLQSRVGLVTNVIPAVITNLTDDAPRLQATIEVLRTATAANSQQPSIAALLSTASDLLFQDLYSGAAATIVQRRSRRQVANTTCVEMENFCHVCADNTTCSFCREAHFLHFGECIAACPTGFLPRGRGNYRKYCEAEQVVSGVTVSCEAGVNQCHSCANETTCDFCREEHYLLDGECVASCPIGYAGVGQGLYRRRCMALNMGTCTDGVNQCHECINSTVCSFCRESYYLLNGVCVPLCPLGYFGVGQGNYRRRCTPETGSTCIDRVNQCHVCTNATSCSFCRESHYLLNGVCVAACPANYTTRGQGVYKRECVAAVIASPTTCMALQNSCQSCANATMCGQCRDERYLHNGMCISSCTAGYLPRGLGQFSRRCIADVTVTPCINGAVMNNPGQSCVCSNNCRMCLNGTCLQCTDSMYLYRSSGQCIDRTMCDSTLGRAFGFGLRNRVCLENNEIGRRPIVVVVSDVAPISNASALTAVQDQLQQDGVSLHALGVGSAADRTYLDLVSGDTGSLLARNAGSAFDVAGYFMLRHFCASATVDRNLVSTTVTTSGTTTATTTGTSASPTAVPTLQPSASPTLQPSAGPTGMPTAAPTNGCNGLDDHVDCYTAFGVAPQPRCDDLLVTGRALGTQCPGHCSGFCSTTPSPTPCTQPDPGVCTQPVDIAFLIDGSLSLSNSDFTAAKNFIKAVVATLDVANTSSRVAVAQFSSTVQSEVSFSNGLTQGAVNTAVDAMVQLRGGTRTSDALDFLRDTVFTTSSGMRPDSAGVPRLMLVLTDGLANTGFEPTAAALSLMQTRNVSRSFAVGVVGSTDITRMRAELERIAFNESANVYAVSNFGNLSAGVIELTTQVCEVTPTPCPSAAPTSPSETLQCFGQDDTPNCNNQLRDGVLHCNTLQQQSQCPQLCGLCTAPPTMAPTLSPTAAPSDIPTMSPTNSPTAFPSPMPTMQPTRAPTVVETSCTGVSSNGQLSCSCSNQTRSNCYGCDFTRGSDGIGVPGTCTACKNGFVLLRGQCVDAQTCLMLGYTVTGQGQFNLECACDDYPALLQNQAVAERIQTQLNSSRLIFFPSCASARFLCNTADEVRVICRTTCTGLDQSLCTV